MNRTWTDWNGLKAKTHLMRLLAMSQQANVTSKFCRLSHKLYTILKCIEVYEEPRISDKRSLFIAIKFSMSQIRIEKHLLIQELRTLIPTLQISSIYQTKN